MSAQKDPYKELSLPQTATPEQIRRAYKKLCLRWHPDKHPEGTARTLAETRFKAVVLAYSILSDPTSRAAYDAQQNTTSEPPPDPFADPEYRRSFARRFAKQFAAEGHSVRADDLFESLFGAARDTFQTNFFNPRPKAPDKDVDLPLTLEELFSGCIKKRRLRRPPNSTAPPTILSIGVQPGYRPGDKIRFRDAACSADNLPHDVVFTISAKPHERFTLRNDDLHLTMRVRLVDALAGAVLVVQTLDGANLKIRVDSVIHPAYIHRVPSHGMPRRNEPSSRGDLVIAFSIIFPARVESEDRAAVRDLFARVDTHSRDRLSIRRSSSLFMSRQSAAGILHHRRHSTSATPQPAPSTEPSPPVEPEAPDVADTTKTSDATPAPMPTRPPTPPAPHDLPAGAPFANTLPTKRPPKTIWKFPSIFR